jgi:hypothetical protein
MKPVTGLALGSLMFTVGLVTGLTWMPSSIADAIAYGSAAACQEPAANGSGCWTEVGAVVTGTHVVPRVRGNSDWVVELSDQFGTQRPQVAHREDFNHLTPGEPVSVRFWKGQVALIRIPGGGDLPTDNEPGRQVGFASLVALFSLLGGLIFFLGAVGVHRHSGSWTLSVSRAEWSDDLFDAVSPPARRWLEAIILIPLVGLAPAFLVWAWFDVPLVPAAAVGLGFTSLGWSWLLHVRARQVMRWHTLP